MKVYATSGCCSQHEGVDCTRKQSNGKVVCNDGWKYSSCYYSSMKKCKNYDIMVNNIEKQDNKVTENKKYLPLILGVLSITGGYYLYSKKGKK